MKTAWKNMTLVSFLVWAGACCYYLLFVMTSSPSYHSPRPVYDPRRDSKIDGIGAASYRKSQHHQHESRWSKVMAERKKKVKEVCGQHQKVLRRFMNHNRLLFDTKHHLAYCRNAKAGTTNWLSTLLMWSGVDTSGKSPEEIHDIAVQVFPGLGPREAAKEMQHPAISFTVVRHPFTRLVSAYRDKMRENYRIDVQQSIISKYRQNNTASAEALIHKTEQKLMELLLEATGENMNDIQRKYLFFRPLQTQNIPPALNFDPSIPTFREFALFVSDSLLSCGLAIYSACVDSVDVHWQPYYNRCAPCDIKYNVIAKVETFQEDQQHIQHIANISKQGASVTSVNSHASEGPSTLSLTRMYFSQLSPVERVKVYLAYYFDFQLFGYSPDDIVL